MKTKYILLLSAFVMGSLSEAALASCRDIRLSGSVDAEVLWKDFSTLASEQMQGRKTGTPGSKLAREYIANQFNALSLKTFEQGEGYFLPFRYEMAFDEITGVNVAGWIEGKTFPEDFIVITAHYDHLGTHGRKIFYGADDNASGVAALISIARDVVEKGSHYSVLFLATDAEEKGLYGAKAFVQEPPLAIEKMRFNLNLDMLSQGGRKKALYVSGGRTDERFKGIIKQVKEEAGICLVKGHRAPRSGSAMSNRINWRQASDHYAFSKKNIPYLFVGVSTHSYYHTPKDTVESVEPTFYTGAVETSLMLFRGLDALQPEKKKGQ